MNNGSAPLHGLVPRPELRENPDDPTSLPLDRLELYFTMRAEFKHLMLLFHEVYMSSQGARDAARVMARAANRFARTAEAFADAEPVTSSPVCPKCGPISVPLARHTCPYQNLTEAAEA